MAISIDWDTKIVSIPKADLTLVDAGPPEIREIDLDWFRMELKAIEASEEGIPYLDIHRHITETTLSGVTYARFVEIINGYTVTFEDGQYAVNTVGANTNLADVTNVNQVSLRLFNSAGLQKVSIGSGVLPQDILDIATEVWNTTRSGHEIKQLLENRLVIDESTSELLLYADDGITILKKWPITNKDGTAVVLVGTGPANRGVRTL